MIWPFKKKPPEDLSQTAEMVKIAREQARREREALSELLSQTLRKEEHG